MPKKFDHEASEILLDALANNQIDIVKDLVKQGYPVNTFLDSGTTALAYVVCDTQIEEEDKDTHLELVRYLIDIGSDLNAMDDGVSKPIHIALRKNVDPRIVELLAEMAPEAIDSYAIGLAENSNNPGLYLQAIGRPDLIDDPEPQKAAAITTEPSDLYKAFGTDDALEAMRMYRNDPTVKQNKATLDKIMSGEPISSKAPAKKGIFSKMKLWNVQEIKYDNDLNDIFKNLPALNMDQQKEVNKMAMNIDSLLKPTSFSLGLFEVAAVSDNLPLTLIPNEFLSYSYEQISHILGKMQNYFYGDNSSHEA